MSCVINKPVAGPDLTLYRGTASEYLWRAYREGTVPYQLEDAGVEVRFVVADGIGFEATILATLSSDNVAEIVFGDPDDSYFTTYFKPGFFDDLPGGEYKYAMWGYPVSGEPFVLTLPATITIAESIGPPPA